ncbi:MAG TPA: hypothetical protein DFR83_10385 [Deltaproteobacteria bacterium]|nr:hypothetical protein [Deltaproteobacteria bacterium]
MLLAATASPGCRFRRGRSGSGWCRVRWAPGAKAWISR